MMLRLKNLTSNDQRYNSRKQRHFKEQNKKYKYIKEEL